MIWGRIELGGVKYKSIIFYLSNIYMVVIIKKGEIVNTLGIDFDDNNHINITTNVSSSYAVISDILWRHLQR